MQGRSEKRDVEEETTITNQTNGNPFRGDEIIMAPWNRNEEKRVKEILSDVRDAVLEVRGRK
jgi:hypothetical protein